MNTYVGIDIAAKSFDLVSRQAGRAAKVLHFKQTPEGHAQAIKHLQSLRPVIIVMEATGIYYLDLAVALTAADLPVAVINPRSFHHFAKLKLSGSKTDPIDAALLAEYGERMAPRQWSPPDESYLALRDLGRQISRLTRALTQAKNRLHALQAKHSTLPVLIKDEQEGITLLDRRLERLSQAAEALIRQNETLNRHMKNLCAAKGIAMRSAIALLAELVVLPAHLKAPQVSRYAGLDVKLKHSGSKVHRPARLSKAGNAYLRAALYMPAMCAARCDPRAKAFYDTLVGRGKKKIQAQCAVMRKYLTGLWACMRHDTAFDSSLLFSDEFMNT